MVKKSCKNLVFVSAGGRGRRLFQYVPGLEKSGLPKSLGIVINDRPLIAYQLDHLVKMPDCQIILSFSDSGRSIKVFKKYLETGKIPKFDYLYNTDAYSPNNTSIDIIKISKPHRPWEQSFETITITSGDIFFGSGHMKKMLNIYKTHNCSSQTICDFDKYMISLDHHFLPVYDEKNNLFEIKRQDTIPDKIICHPQFITEKAFRIYYQMPKNSSKSGFVIHALSQGEKFKVVKANQYVNVNFPEDYNKLFSFIEV